MILVCVAGWGLGGCWVVGCYVTRHVDMDGRAGRTVVGGDGELLGRINHGEIIM
jgi:hypothetical protein